MTTPSLPPPHEAERLPQYKYDPTILKRDRKGWIVMSDEELASRLAQARTAAIRAFGEQVKALPIVKNELISNKFTLNDFFGETIDRLIEEAGHE